jgi:hypothetical protein
VAFTVRANDNSGKRLKRLPEEEFVRRFRLHVLPTGIKRIRHYGVTDQGETPLSPGMCAGFRAGTGNAHPLVNRTNTDVLYLEVGDHAAGDAATYRDDDVQAALGHDGNWQYAHKNGTPY